MDNSAAAAPGHQLWMATFRWMGPSTYRPFRRDQDRDWVLDITVAEGCSGPPTALTPMRMLSMCTYGRRANAHGSIRRSRRNQIAGRISPAPGAAGCSAAVEVELGPARIRASLTGAPDRDKAVDESGASSDTAEGSKRKLRAHLAV